jgi:DNA-binding SARP family transcriptional activator
MHADESPRALPPLRFEAPHAPAWTLARPRLLRQLGERFDARIVTIVGGGGFGKSTLLSHAIAENALSPTGRDVWLRVVEADRAPDHLLSGLLRTLTDPYAGAPAVASVDDVLDAAWAWAPERVAIVLDDTHRLGDDAPTWATLGELVERLPTNASMVLAGRRRPRLKLAHLRTTGAWIEIDEADLAYTQDEAAAVAERLGGDAADAVAAWPALTTLQCRAGATSSIEYLWEQVIDGLEPTRRALLATVAPFSSISDKLLDAIAPGSGIRASELVAGLPLVESDDHDSFRLHDLWAAALADEADPDERRRAARRAGEHLLEIGEFVPAAEAFAIAHDDDRLAEVVRRASARPLGSALDTAEAAALLELLPRPLLESASGELLRAARLFATQPNLCVDAYRSALAMAQAAGNDEDAVVAHWRIAQIATAVGPDEATIPPDLERLAGAGHPLAISACAMIRSHGAALRGDVRAALAEVDNYEIPDVDSRRGSIASRLLALGRPEMVTAHLDAVLADGVSDPLAAQAIWFRGDISPDDAWPIARDLPAAYARRNMKTVQLALTSIVAQVGAVAGDLVGSHRLVDAAIDLCEYVPFDDRMFALAAKAMLLACEGDEAGFVAVVDELEQLQPVLPFPAWPYMSILTALRALVPGCEALDDADLGPSMATAVAAGAAIRRLRDDADPTAAAALPWSQLDLLRVHVPPPMLTELAVAVAGSAPAARSALDVVPGAAARIHALADGDHGPTRTAAQTLVPHFPLRPTQPLVVTTFGRFAIAAPDGRILVGDQTRGRVRDLIARVMLAGTVDRQRVAEEMWPDLDIGKARDNLRATLRHAVRELEVAGERPYLEVTDQSITLPADLLDIDRDRFDRTYDAALTADRNANPSAALDGYLAAIALATGEYLPEYDTDDVRFERIRLSSLAHVATCRAAELLLAKGEPEWSLELASRGLRDDALSERAARSAIGCHLTLGSAAAARDVACGLLTELRRAGLTPAPETVAMLDRAGVHPDD